MLFILLKFSGCYYILRVVDPLPQLTELVALILGTGNSSVNKTLNMCSSEIYSLRYTQTPHPLPVSPIPSPSHHKWICLF